MTQLTLSTVALLALDERVSALLMISKGANAAFYCVELDKASVLFVSPFYEHTLTLRQAGLSETAESTLTRLGLSSDRFLAVADWHKWACTLEPGLTIATAPNRLRAVLARTFFVQSGSSSDCTKIDCESINSCFGEKGSLAIASVDLLQPYLTRFNLLRAKKAARASCVTPFWEWVEERDADAIDHAVNMIFAFVKKGTTFPNLESIVDLLQKWKSPARRLLAHKATSIERLHALHRTTPPRCDIVSGYLCDTITFSLFDAALCAPQFQLEACKLVKALWNLFVADEEAPQMTEEIPLDLYFAEKQMGNGGIARYLNSLYARYSGKFKSYHGLLRKRVIKLFLLPLVRAKTEKDAFSHSQRSRGTLQPITVRPLYHAFHTLFVTSRGEESATPAPFSLDEQGGETDDTSVLLHFDEADFRQLVASLCDPLVMAPYLNVWQPTSRVLGEEITNKTVLFYVRTQPVLLALEEKIGSLWRTHVLDEALSVMSIDQPLLSLDTNPFNEHDTRQQFRILLFNPAELRRGDDIDVMRRLVADDFFGTAILRESSVNHMFHARVADGFASEFDEETVRRDLYFESAHFQQIDKRAQRPTVIVTDCHLIGAEALINLLKWLHCHSETVRHVALFGTLDILPLFQNGQPFLDLLRVTPILARTINRYVWDASERTRDFRTLLEEHWVVRRARGRLTGTDYVDPLMQSVMYAVSDPVYLLENVAPFKEQKRLCVHQLVLPGCEKHQVTIALHSVKQRAHISLCPLMSIDSVTQYSLPKSDVFVITRGMLLLLNKNQLNVLFSSLHVLVVVVVEKEENTLLESIVTQFTDDWRPNTRYTSSSIKPNQ